MITPASNIVTLGQWDFHEIRPGDLAMYSEFIKTCECPANLWSSNFAYLWASSQSKIRKVLWRVVDGMLATFGLSYKNSLYLYCLPFGEGHPEKLAEVVLKCMEYCHDWNNQEKNRTMVRMINQNQLDFLRNCPDFDARFRLQTLQGIERHLDVEKVASLYGKDFSNIRNRVNKFHRENPDAVIRRYRKSDYDGLIALGKSWSRGPGEKYSAIFDKVYYRTLINRWAELNQIILVVQTGGRIIGMVSGGELPTGQAWGSLLKYEDGIPGLSETLSVEFARELCQVNPDIALINIGSDLGPGGLREYKLKFRPVLNLKRYQIFFR